MMSVALNRVRPTAQTQAPSPSSSGNVEVDQIAEMLAWGELKSKTQRHDPQTDTDYTDYRFMGGMAMVFEMPDGSLYPYLQLGARGRLYYPADMLKEARGLGYHRFKGAHEVVVENGKKTRVFDFDGGSLKYTYKDGEGPNGPTFSNRSPRVRMM